LGILEEARWLDFGWIAGGLRGKGASVAVSFPRFASHGDHRMRNKGTPIEKIAKMIWFSCGCVSLVLERGESS
jgi:hypothetical protein